MIDERVVASVDDDMVTASVIFVDTVESKEVVSVPASWLDTNRISSIATASSKSVPQ